MQFDVKVKNLGKLKAGSVSIRPITVIVGPNATGKSFFTKTLYSILNSIHKNSYAESIGKNIREIQLNLEILVINLEDEVNCVETEELRNIKLTVDNLQKEFEEVKDWDNARYIGFVRAKAGSVNALHEKFKAVVSRLNEQDFKNQSIKFLVFALETVLKTLDRLISKVDTYYKNLGFLQITDELKENFQISNLDELISFGERESVIEIIGWLKITLSDDAAYIDTIEHEIIDKISQLSNIFFLESPAYWKVREPLLEAERNRFRRGLFRQSENNILTSVPKYFYELDAALNVKTKARSCFKEAIKLLEDTLNGQFDFKDERFSFTDKLGHEISKNLISLGMTSLGMIHVLLKNDIITNGSFVFFDEPETNLHPDWQLKLMRVLLILAQQGVNIVLNTHSTDTLKALEVIIKKLNAPEVNNFLSINYFDTDGKLYKFESNDSIQQLIEANSLLNATYELLYFQDL